MLRFKLACSLLIPLLGFFFAATVEACPQDGTRVFYCRTTNNKTVEVCDLGTKISYSFGRAGRQPELALAVPRNQATSYQWQGIGRYMSYSVTIPNGNTKYEVFLSVDRLSDDHPLEAGINVSVDDRHLATIECAPNSLYQSLEGIDLPLEQ